MRHEEPSAIVSEDSPVGALRAACIARMYRKRSGASTLRRCPSVANVCSAGLRPLTKLFSLALRIARGILPRCKVSASRYSLVVSISRASTLDGHLGNVTLTTRNALTMCVRVCVCVRVSIYMCVCVCVSVCSAAMDEVEATSATKHVVIMLHEGAQYVPFLTHHTQPCLFMTWYCVTAGMLTT